MSVLINSETSVICQGITGGYGGRHAKACLDYGTKLVAGVTPGKGGLLFDSEGYKVPVYNTVKEARVQHGANATMIFVPPAFAADAMYGGIIGVMNQGFKRAAFSNEAGIGSASIAHSAAKTDEPVSEGMVSLLEPFIDTVVICTMTALVIVISGYGD